MILVEMMPGVTRNGICDSKITIGIGLIRNSIRLHGQSLNSLSTTECWKKQAQVYLIINLSCYIALNLPMRF